MVFQAVGKLLGKHKIKKKAPAETEKLYLDPRCTSSRILDADILMLVALPKGVNVDEWLASNASAFYNHISLMYGSISEFCTISSCPTMKAWAIFSGLMKRAARENALDHSMQIMLPASSKKSLQMKIWFLLSTIMSGSAVSSRKCLNNPECIFYIWQFHHFQSKGEHQHICRASIFQT
ncbi:MOB kinase activator-like 2 isoform X3 [Pyxicephalus adspersus]|uniref:MOB kinase activator-like 2 isoform X3 n=1 Tax=Pyxicephalus adspersus TaxID=30357 RepID=UPI003B5B25C4